jgi:hypothetical protein
MANPQAGTKHRTTVHIAELCLQSAEDYHQQYLYKFICKYHKARLRPGLRAAAGEPVTNCLGRMPPVPAMLTGQVGLFG